LIKVRNLTKYYGERLAVDKINFDIGKGEIVGLLGPNAAGKTTTMRMLTGFMMPPAGMHLSPIVTWPPILSRAANTSVICPNLFRSTRYDGA